MKIIAVSSGGGHFAELLKITNNLPKDFQIVIITEKTGKAISNVDYYIPYSNRNHKVKYLFAFIRNFYYSFQHIKKVKPDFIISTGAHTAFFYFIIGKLFFKTTNIYIESFAKVNSTSLAYRLSKRFIDKVIVQHQELQLLIPNSEYFGGVY